MNKHLLLTIPVATLAVAALAPGVAHGHNAAASGTCQGGVTWSATNYNKELVNSITVTIDGTVVHNDPDFKASDTGTAATDRTLPHTWSVVVNAPGSEFDKAFSGSYGACETAPTTTVAQSTTTTVAATTTTVPATTVPTTDPVATTLPGRSPVPIPNHVVAVDIPPVPPTTLPAPAAASSTPASPVLPRTGLDGSLVALAALFLIVGVYLVIRGRRSV